MIYIFCLAIHEAVFYWFDKTLLRIVMLDGLDDVSANRLINIRPTPSYYVVVAPTTNMTSLINTVSTSNNG